MRVVLDSVIIVRALINPRSHCGQLIFDYRRAYDLVVSSQLAAEYRDVLGRPEVVRKFRAAALAGDADYIVSEDRDLLDLKSFEGVSILTAQAFIAVVQRKAI